MSMFPTGFVEIKMQNHTPPHIFTEREPKENKPL